MNIDLDVRFIGRKEIEVDYGDRKEKRKVERVLCFTHATQAAMRGELITMEIDDFGGEGDFRRTHCEEC